jgi:predicted HNH restriction endonuclease
VGINGIKEIMSAHFGTGAPENTYRRTTFAVKPKKCERCGYDTNPAAIIVHHKDRNRSNDAITNLEVLCCNCHAIEHWGEES